MCNSDNKNCSLISLVTGIVVAAAAIAGAVFLVMKFFEHKNRCDYIECDCCGDYDGFEDSCEFGGEKEPSESEEDAE